MGAGMKLMRETTGDACTISTVEHAGRYFVLRVYHVAKEARIQECPTTDSALKLHGWHMFNEGLDIVGFRHLCCEEAKS